MKVERVKTGIPGLDELMEGGFPKGSVILVSGGPGSGKTTLCLQFLVQGALKYKEKSIYVSLEEDESSMISMITASFRWPIENLLKKKMVKIVRAELYEFDKLKMLINDEVESMGAERLAIDPTTLLSLYFEKPLEVRRGLIELKRLIKKIKCTTLLTCEVPEGKKGISTFGIEEFATDGIIVLYYIREGNVFIRALSVRKLRATNHDSGIHPFKITKDGIKVFPKEQVFSSK